MESLEEKVKSVIRDIPDFPKEGINFKDITTLLANPELNGKVLKAFELQASKLGVEAVIGIDSRGFLYGNNIASNLNIPFIPVRKKGKLPYSTIEETYGSKAD